MLRDRADSDHFVKKGFVGEEGKDPLLFYGKRTDKASAEWNYYAKKDGVEYPVIFGNRDCMSRRGCKELDNGEVVRLKGFGGRSFKVSI